MLSVCFLFAPPSMFPGSVVLSRMTEGLQGRLLQSTGENCTHQVHYGFKEDRNSVERDFSTP